MPLIYEYTAYAFFFSLGLFVGANIVDWLARREQRNTENR
jgi:hypothetical protein